MELVNPGIGLIFWMTLSFMILLFILKKYAWKPIMDGLKKREGMIEDSLQAAERAKDEMKNLKADNEKLMKEAREERDALLRDARKVREEIIDKSKDEAYEEKNRIVESAKQEIENEKLAAITDLKNQIAQISINIAEKVLKEELKPSEKHNKLVNELVEKSNLN